MSGFQHSQLINFFDSANADLVSTLSAKFGFDANEALAYLKGIAPTESAPGPVKKGKKSKDPNAPKKAPTAFFLFSKEFRAEQKESLAGMKASEVAKLAGARWSEIKETDDAADFHAEAARLKAERAELVASRSDASSPAPVIDVDQATAELSTPSPSSEATTAAPAAEKPKKAKKAKMTDEEKAAKKAAKLAEKEAAKPQFPSISLPYMGALPGCCHGIRNNHGLYTQCTKAPTDGDFCSTCTKQAAKNTHGMPNCGTIETRGNPDWRAPNGQQPVTYATFLQKEGNHNHVLEDHSIAEAEAAKFGWTIPAGQWQETPRRQGRPKTAKTAVVTDSSASESEGPAAVDLVQKLVNEAKAAAPQLGDPEPEPVSVPVQVENTSAAPSSDLGADDFEEEPPLKVSPFTFEGVDYLIDRATNELYCTHTHEVVGVLKEPTDGQAWIEFIDAPTDGEEDDE